MSRVRRPQVTVLMVAGLVLGAAAPAWAVEAGITLDVHQDIYPQQYWPNDFHIEGLICSNNGTIPMVIEHIDGLFANFTYTMTKMPGDDCWYWFEATWVTQNGSYIPYCTVIHVGVLFDVDAANVIIDLVGWWTRNGAPVGNMYGSLRNRGFVPLVGFNVADTGTPQVLTVGNGDLPITPVLPVPPTPPPWPPQPIQLAVTQLEVIPFPPGSPPPLAALRETGPQQSWPWIPVVFPDGQPISAARPLYMAPDSFFDVFLEMSEPPADGLGVQTPFSIQPGGFLVTRQLVTFMNNNNQSESRWFWEIHGAQAAQACCFPDGHCEDLVPFACAQRGGQPMGPNTNCLSVVCPHTEIGACCFGEYQCALTDPVTCAQQYAGTWKGPGTTCDDLNGNGYADICEPATPLGACCYGQVAPLCVVTEQLTCEQQYLGVWKGPGTTCADLNSNGIADICEPVVEPEACCLPDGTCQMLPAQDCVNLGGTPLGVHTHCLGDLNGNGVDDLCELKWMQPPDLSTNGIDVRATQPLVLADDFLCDMRALITEIVVFGSWYHDVLPEGGPASVRFTLSLHADIPDPDGSGPGYSMPGPALWLKTFEPGQFTVEPFATNIREGWWDPRTAQSYEFPGDTVCWVYYFNIPATEAFCQLGTPDEPRVYWLDVQAIPLGATATQFGWKTSTRHWNDAAVWGLGVEPYPGPWNMLRYPAQHQLAGQAIDLAFAVGGTLPCPPQICRGDSDCDGRVSFSDIDFFVASIPDNVAAWKALHMARFGHLPTCLFENNDANGDGHVNFSDIDPFVALIPSVCP